MLMVPNICCQLFRTIANGPEHLWMILGVHGWSANIFNVYKFNLYVMELGMLKLKEK